MTPENLTDALAPTQQLLAQLIAALPRLAVSAVVLLLGWLLSRVAASGTRWLVQRIGLDALAERGGVARLLYGAGVKEGFAAVLARVVALAVQLVTLSVVAELLGLPGVAEGINVLLEFLPHFIAAALIVVGGLVAAEVLQGIVERIGREREDLDSPVMLAKAAYYVVATVSISLAAEHLGLEIALINALIQIAAAALLFSVGLSLALGARDTFHDIIARHYSQRAFLPGDRIIVGDVEGTIVRYGPLSVWIRADAGVVVIPCSSLLSQKVTLPELSE